MQNVFVEPSGQDDNLGDSALRVGLLRALDDRWIRIHLHLDGQSSDYIAGIPVTRNTVFYPSRREWLAASRSVERPVFAVNAGEINPQPEMPFPNAERTAELRRVVERGGVVIAAGLGVKDLEKAAQVAFERVLVEAAVVSWRDHSSRDAVGFGDAAPDWAFALGSATSEWAPRDERDVIAVTLRFDRPWPDNSWHAGVREFAARTGTRIVTVAQVARDAPMAVRLAEVLGGEYLAPASMRHDDLDRHVRAVYSRALAVVSDRAHGLIIGATEGAYPLGTAADPQKIARLLDAAGVGALTGHHHGFAERARNFEDTLPTLAGAITGARRELDVLGARIRGVIASGPTAVRSASTPPQH